MSEKDKLDTTEECDILNPEESHVSLTQYKVTLIVFILGIAILTGAMVFIVFLALL